MSAIDTPTFQKLRDSTDPDFVVELVQTFLDDAPQLLASLRAASGAGDSEAFRRAAHTLKSNSNTFGALALAACARELEQGGPAKASLEQIEGLYQAASAELRSLIHA